MWERLTPSGLVVAGIGFFLTRFTVTLALDQDPVTFYLAGVLPLVLGLGLAATGVALAVADVDRALVRSTARWCVLGTAAMLVLVVLTVVGSSAAEMPVVQAIRSRTYLANFLIGGSVGGTLTGLYAARSARRRRAVDQQANRLEVLNRLLRHEVLNAVTAIRGYAQVPDEAGSRDPRDVILRRAGDIEDTIEEVKYLARTADPEARRGSAVDLRTCLENSVTTVSEAMPSAEIRLDPPPRGLTVVANDRVEQVFVHLLENAVLHTEADHPRVEVSVDVAATSVRVHVADDGPGLPEGQRRLLETGDIGEFDDPGSGFGLNVVRLLVESYRGTIGTEVTDSGSTVTVDLPRGTTAGDVAGTVADTRAAGVTTPRLAVSVGAALLAGLLMGLVSEAISGGIPIIGALYGVQSGVVGWITHEFHSVVFGFVFAGLVALGPARYRESPLGHVGIGTVWGVVLWLVAAGVVMPLWLGLVGIPAPVPNVRPVSLVTHGVWGASLGLLTYIGYEHVAPHLAAAFDRVARARN